jgi:hypothetical protein
MQLIQGETPRKAVLSMTTKGFAEYFFETQDFKTQGKRGNFEADSGLLRGSGGGRRLEAACVGYCCRQAATPIARHLE